MKNKKTPVSALILSGFIFFSGLSNIYAQDTANKSQRIDPAQEQQNINQLQENRNGDQTLNNDGEAQNNGQAAIDSKLKVTNTKKIPKKDTLPNAPDTAHRVLTTPPSSTQKPVTPVAPPPSVPPQPSPVPPPVTPPNGAQVRQPNGQLNTPPPQHL